MHASWSANAIFQLEHAANISTKYMNVYYESRRPEASVDRRTTGSSALVRDAIAHNITNLEHERLDVKIHPEDVPYHIDRRKS